MSIRFATPADIPQMLQIYAPYVLHTATSFEYTVPTQEAFTRRFSEKTAQCPWLVWEEAGQVLGYAYGSEPFERSAYGWCAEVSIYLHPDIQGRGIGTRLYRVLETLLFSQGYRKLYAIITSENTDSLAFHKALGYTERAVFPDCGFKFGRWIGTVWLEKCSNLSELPTQKPISIQTLVKNHRNFPEVLDKMPLS